MLDQEIYEIMKEKYGTVSSWAIWDEVGSTPRSNTDSMKWVEDPDLLEIINTGYVFVGLNASSTHGNQNGHFDQPWAGFHSGYCRQNDYKLRYALHNTKYWGSYITDVIKNYPEVDSSNVKRYLKTHPEVVRDNIQEFRKEISYLGDKPILIAMGNDANRILRDNLGDDYQVVNIKHYSYAISKENYRGEILNKLKEPS